MLLLFRVNRQGWRIVLPAQVTTETWSPQPDVSIPLHGVWLIDRDDLWQLESTDESLFLGPAAKPIRQLFIHRSAVPHGHEADDSFLVTDCVDDTKAANAILV